MIDPGYQNMNGISPSGGQHDDLEERKRQLVQRLMAGRGAPGHQGVHAMPLFGGRGRGSSDLPNAGLPQLSFNPFLAMAAGRNEQFQAPNGITAGALAQAQSGLAGPIGGAAPQEIPGNGADAAGAFLGSGVTQPGVDGPAATTPPPTANNLGLDPGFLMGSSSQRHLAGPDGQPLQVGANWLARIGSVIAR